MPSPIQIPTSPAAANRGIQNPPAPAAPSAALPQALPPVGESAHSGETRQEPGLQRPAVLQAFLSQLDGRDGGLASLKEQIFGLMSRFSASPESLPTHAGNLARLCRMPPEAFAANLEFQLSNATLFHSPLFSALYALLGEHSTPALRKRLGAFLAEYDRVFNAGFQMQSLLAALETMEETLPKAFAARLKEQNALLLRDGNPADGGPGALAENVRRVKEEILPIFGEYAMITNERGAIRDRISHIVHLLSGLNLASGEALSGAFEALLSHLKYEANLPQARLETLAQLFRKAVNEPERPENAFWRAFGAFLREEAEPGGSPKPGVKSALLPALLTEASVFMPYLHVMLPVLHRDKPIFCDVYAEKNPAPGDENAFLLYISVEIRGAGHFGLKIGAEPAGLALELYIPARFQEHKAKIARAAREILSARGLSCAGINCAAGPPPDPARFIRRKAAERSGGVHVKI